MSEGVSPLPEGLEEIARQIARELRDSLDDLVEGWYRRMEVVPQLVSWRRSDVRELVLPHARVDIGRELAGLVDGRELPSASPEEVLESARMAAVNGLPLWATLQAYRVGHAEQWQAWSEAVERRELAPADRRALLDAGSNYFFAYADRCMRWIEIEYTHARETPLRREEQRRVQIVRRLLEGYPGNHEGLGYDISQWHLGVVAAGPGIERVIGQVAERVDAAVLTVAAEASTTWMWIGSSSAPAEVQDQLTALLVPSEVILAVGEPEPGQNGFRLTHVQAQTAAAIGAKLGQAITLYREVALEDLAGHTPERACAFASRELGPLASPTREAGVLRETLSAYFACAQRASSAAKQLGVHERTIGNRLHRVQQLIGRPVSGRQAELEVAIRLHTLLHDQFSEPTAKTSQQPGPPGPVPGKNR